MPVDYVETLVAQKGAGFVFDNYQRNQFLASSDPQAFKMPDLKKTGTTICGVVCDGGVVLGADTRATAGDIVADKNCEKLHKMADNICCAGAGTAADLEHTTKKFAADLELMRLTLHRTPRVGTAVTMLSQHLFRYMGYVGCALVMGGVDPTGPSLYMIYPHGSTDRLPFASMGSGSLAAMSMLETGYKDDMTIEEGKKLVSEAILAGITNDLGSGGQVDLCVVTKDAYTMHRNIMAPYPRTRIPKPVMFPTGTTTVLEEVKMLKGRLEVTDADVEMRDA
ncbi:unnamed protein product [Vitrella brassicaformis CCMP3155]|uniref:Proteasome subunit beta n=2 Tax=Vitrella brassicaformis TaxID=1169539 RepID=A0A0G4FJU9_VITBC|nr:unnamed protein product [Vitrella brassicaformis CCMP3155]|mmetsp:Transcript_10477/g.25356  ORF Transcript_10477/g.25356 Transcript_10477/m.25356 type:complete len:280 (+) Transcript_10477:112-951(+)|eukprot:CEM14053.1 unnamed protein product [Vitrella brassicaformis CCMP3155]